MPHWTPPPEARGAWSADVQKEDQNLRKRIGWLNSKGGFEGAISYNKVLEAAGGLEFTEVFAQLKQLEEKKDTVKDPTGWLVTGLRRLAQRQTVGPQFQPPTMRSMAPPQWAPPPMAWGGPMHGAPPMDEATTSKLHKRIKWLNDKGGFNNAIVFDKVQEAAEGVQADAMMKILKELEEKKDSVTNATAYVTSALRKLGGGRKNGSGLPGVKRDFKVKQEKK